MDASPAWTPGREPGLDARTFSNTQVGGRSSLPCGGAREPAPEPVGPFRTEAWPTSQRPGRPGPEHARAQGDGTPARRQDFTGAPAYRRWSGRVDFTDPTCLGVKTSPTLHQDLSLPRGLPWLLPTRPGGGHRVRFYRLRRRRRLAGAWRAAAARPGPGRAAV
jgi:hypothetical protein